MSEEKTGIEERISEALRKVVDGLNEQEWFQDLRGRWDELEPQQRRYATWGVGGVVALIGGWIVLGGIYGVYSQRSEYQDKVEILTMIESARDEIRRNKAGPGTAGEEKPNWATYFSDQANQIAIDPQSLVISKEKPGKNTKMSRESLFDLQLNQVNIKQVVGYSFKLETGLHPVKIRHLDIQTIGAEGFLNAKMAVSAFVLKK